MENRFALMIVIVVACCANISCTTIGREKRFVRYGDYKMEYKTNVGFTKKTDGLMGLSKMPLEVAMRRIVVTCKYEISPDGEIVFSSLDAVDMGKAYTMKLPLSAWEPQFSNSKSKLTNSGLKTLKMKFPNQTIIAIDSWLLFY
jgi:hypothetical protein